MFPPLGYPPLWSHPRSPSVISALISLLGNHDRYCIACGEWEGQCQLVVSGRGSASLW